MLELGLFEKINSNIEGHSGIAVKDREKIQIKLYNEEMDKIGNKTKFNLLKMFGIKRF